MRLDDYCCLGRTVPEESRKYGWKVCSAGYSVELNSFIRVYPLPIVNPLQQRSIGVLELERNPQDCRTESWRLRRESANNGITAVAAQRSTEQIAAWLELRLSESIAQLNEKRLSIGVIRPLSLDGHFRNRWNGRTDDPAQLLLFEDLDCQFGANAIRCAPYLRFRDESGLHDLQIREWGCYEWLRKQPDRPHQVWDNLRITSSDREVFLLVGNMCHRRNVWLVISVYTRAKNGGLFAEFNP